VSNLTDAQKKRRLYKRRFPEQWKARVLKKSFANHGVVLPLDNILARMRNTPLCTYCGQPIKVREYSVDRVLPKARGGLDELVNLQLVHETCNRMKGNFTDEEFRMILAWLATLPEGMAKELKRRLKASGFMFR
jgi:5-methylcytosine-specific restriction endonuclease McrA